MERKEDLTLTNKQMLVAQLRKEQEQNRILRKELEEANNKLATYQKQLRELKGDKKLQNKSSKLKK